MTEAPDYQSIESAQVTLTTAADKFTYTPSVPVDIIRWGVIADALIDVGVGMTIKLDHRPTAGSDTARTDGLGGKDLVTTVDIAAGDGGYVEPDAPFQVDPGEEVVFQVTDQADTAGTGMLFLHVQPRPFVGDPTATAGGPSNRIAGFTDMGV